MKIIAQTGRRDWRQCYLVEMTEDEITTVGQGGKLETGTEINVSAAWSDLRNFRRAKEQIEKAAETLKACAQLATAAGAVYVIAAEIQAIARTVGLPSEKVREIEALVLKRAAAKVKKGGAE